MKVSEAIRLGSMLHPQGFCSRHRSDGSTCVLGAIEDAVGGKPMSAETLFPFLDTIQLHPVTGLHERLCSILAGLNNRGSYYVLGLSDKKKAWTREKIADWVATLEAAEVPPEPEPEPEPDLELVGA